MKTKLSFLPMALMTLMFLTFSCSVDSDINMEESSATDLTTKAHIPAKYNFTASLSGGNEVPANDSKGAGVAIVKINRNGNSIYFKLITANVENVFAAHFHMAPAGQNGGVVATLHSNQDQPSGPANGVLNEGTITAQDVSGALAGDLDALIEAIRNGNIYINVHTAAVPSGELRGQL